MDRLVLSAKRRNQGEENQGQPKSNGHEFQTTLKQARVNLLKTPILLSE
jgi:hypothetical protein